jgi:hypothetical protein
VNPNNYVSDQPGKEGERVPAGHNTKGSDLGTAGTREGSRKFLGFSGFWNPKKKRKNLDQNKFTLTDVIVQVEPKEYESISKTRRVESYRKEQFKSYCSATVGELSALSAQGSPRNKGKSFWKLGVPTPFPSTRIR